MVPVCVYKGDTIPAVQLPNVYIFRPLKFKNEKERREYYRLVRNVKKTLPLAREINRAVIETYEYIETLPDKKAREKHLKLVEKGLKEQYTPIMKKLTFSQGKLLIKLVNRQTDSSSYELVKAFMGPFKAGFYQTFAALFGASLKKEYHPEGEDRPVVTDTFNECFVPYWGISTQPSQALTTSCCTPFTSFPITMAYFLSASNSSLSSKVLPSTC